MFYDDTEKAKLKDRILRHVVKRADEHTSVNILDQDLFKEELSYQEITFLVHEIVNDRRILVQSMADGQFMNPIAMTTSFLKSGGYTAENEISKAATREENRLSGIERQKVMDEAKLASWKVQTFPYIFGIAIIGGLYSIFDIVKTVWYTPEYVTQESYNEDRDKIQLDYKDKNERLTNELHKADMLIKIYESEPVNQENKKS